MEKIKINKADVEDFIWMSYRYCIGRKTIAAAMHADTIRNLIANNPNILSEERKEFCVKDIRDNINTVLKFKQNIKIFGFENYDVYSELLYEISKQEKPNEMKYNINTSTHEIFVEKSDVKVYDYEDYDYIDLIPWVKLANFLDKKMHKKIIVEYNGKTEEIIAYPYPYKLDNFKYVQAWNDINNTFKINPKHIKEIQDI